MSGIIRFEAVEQETTEQYFRGNQFAIDAFTKKYTSTPNETYVQAVKRVVDYIASVEPTKALRTYWSERWFDEIYNDWWHPAGSIMQGATPGRKISLANCTTISLGVQRDDEEWDSLEAIVRNAAYTVTKCAAYRQGLGLDFSRLRPKGLTVLNSANESAGAVHWMRFIDSIGYYIGQKGRIPAMLFSISADHPDVLEFISVKSDYTKIQNANISVQLTDAFYKAVEQDADWLLHFEIPAVKNGEKVWIDVHSTDSGSHFDEKSKRWYYLARQDRKGERIEQTVRARTVLELIAKNMYQNAEPGIQNIDVARKYSNSDYVYDPESPYDSRILSTNACSEQYLSRESLCVLASINAERFSTDVITYAEELAKIGPSINRFLDNVNEAELQYGTYATPHQALAINMLRRTGAGLTNIAGWLFKANEEYGSKDGNEAVSEFMQQFNYELYKSSIALGHEKGSFGLFDAKKFERSPFVKRMAKLGLKFDAMRNVTCSSIAPTGTLSLMFRDLALGYGIEPAFGAYFWKRTRMSGKYEYYFCVPAAVRKLLESHGVSLGLDSDTVKDTWNGKLGRVVAAKIDAAFKQYNIHFKPATAITPMEKLDLMAGVMKSCDSSISVTYMLPENTQWKDIYDFLIEAHKREVKSVAAFPDRKMYGIVSLVPFKDLALALTEAGVTLHAQNFSTDELTELQKTTATVVETEQRIIKTQAPKRPKTLNCDVHHIRFAKQLDKRRSFDYLVVVGLLHGEPYEVFAMENGSLDKKYVKGLLTKEQRGVYSVTFEDNHKINDLTDETSEAEDMLTRSFSAALRHGADIAYLVEQLEKVEGEMWSFSKALARALKKYIKDGTVVSGAKCADCGGANIIRQDGCWVCTACGSSKCQ